MAGGEVGRRAWIAAEFDRRVASYDSSAMHRWQAERAVDLLGRRPGMAVLDVATGTGLAARALARRRLSPGRLVGVDLAMQMLRHAASRSPAEYHYVRADADRLPFRDGTFDAVLCVSAVPYLPDPLHSLREWRRVCQSDAEIVITSLAEDGITAPRLIRSAAAEHGLAVIDPNAVLGTGERITRLAAQAGLICDHVDADSFPEDLGSDPWPAWEIQHRYGFAGPLATAPEATVRRVYASYEAAFHAARSPHQTVLFARARIRPPI